MKAKGLEKKSKQLLKKTSVPKRKVFENRHLYLKEKSSKLTKHNSWKRLLFLKEKDYWTKTYVDFQKRKKVQNKFKTAFEKNFCVQVHLKEKSSK